MHTSQDRAFAARVQRIERTHYRGAHRKTRAGSSGRFPLSFFLTLLVFGLALKALVYANVPQGRYQSLVAALENGTDVEKAAAFVLRPDPVSASVAQYLELPRR